MARARSPLVAVVDAHEMLGAITLDALLDRMAVLGRPPGQILVESLHGSPKRSPAVPAAVAPVLTPCMGRAAPVRSWPTWTQVIRPSRS